ncbi:sperm motility kinase 3A-like [Mus caroli]|uniref:non-specific serine/threonine protein kinase n=1 Tax=Mus caroli TaxID=10089 RepID=A0A6P5P282_MUSCR|nr:sperm motility kinase 3A-like [Mus caroli]
MENFHAQYVMLETLGHGGCAKVNLARHRLTGTHVAVKMFQKRKYWCNLLMSEIQLMMMADHPNIISLLQVIETKKNLYLIMELCEGKTLYQHIRKAGYLQEDEARKLFKQLLSAMNYCHNQGIVHRDLKPDNIMVEEVGKVKIIDFGLGTHVKSGQKLNLYCGTYPFSAPEVLLKRPYDGPKIDVWTLGVVLYFMVTGKIPFNAASKQKLLKRIVARKYSFPSRLSVELCLLKKQILRQCDRPTRAWPVNPSVTPFPSLVDTATFHLRLRRSETKPRCPWSSTNRQVSVCCKSTSRKRDRRVSWPGGLPRPLHTTPTMDHTHTHTRSVPCIYSMFCRIPPKSSDESTEGHTSASAADKPVHSRGWPRGIRGWTRKIGNAMRKLCCCIPSKKTSHVGQNRVSPQK